MTSKQIVILGAGFGGIAAAKQLVKYPEFEVTLIDQNPVHIIHGQLYEVATSPSELTSLPELKRSVEIPLLEVFSGTAVKIITARVESVNVLEQKVQAAGKSYRYDYLISALGSSPNFFAIPGADEHSLHFQTSYDALRIRTAVETALDLARLHTSLPVVNIIIAGGGVAGVEVAAELQGMLNYLSWQKNLSRNKIITTVIERSSAIISTFPERVQVVAAKRLQDLGVEVKLNTVIESVDKHFVNTNQGNLKYDIFIWAAGVRANPLPTIEQFPIKKGDRIEVDSCFRPPSNQSIFILGDQCSREDDNSGLPLPGTASQAIYQAKYVARAIRALAANQPLPKFQCQSFPYLIPLGPKWAIFASGNRLIAGYFGYLIRQLVWLRYYSSILGLRKGLHWLWRTAEIYSRND
ncbi:MAG TPA: FAD-dependent oxidoreductase [Candidatus Doudnabacteria bacterium]|nr:FAD-dependent oxidoreductase [Candidatus Doudnabacteria bacterium]